jgi:hypothetical protein
MVQTMTSAIIRHHPLASFGRSRFDLIFLFILFYKFQQLHQLASQAVESRQP